MKKKGMRYIGAGLIALGYASFVSAYSGLINDVFRIIGLVFMGAGVILLFANAFLLRTGKYKGWAEDEKLTHIEGIGPAISRILNDNGIKSYKDLASRTPDDLSDILNAASFDSPFDPTSWPVQADLAAKGKWKDLEKLQFSLKKPKRTR